eukprot:TRINITY_DN43161_c0_g1_i1.p1 TRINITY_DN43161_c0_g1~~TRINITY_DN43161_c0_g1_i1.p1  ORF type:complete len:504 (-),score=69.33 TRINITY_DN43161_c0_g1_i1:231-1706(-)
MALSSSSDGLRPAPLPPGNGEAFRIPPRLEMLPRGPITPRSHRDWSARMWLRMDRNRNGALSREELDCEELRNVIRCLVAPSVGTSTGGAGAPYTRAEMNTQQAVSFCLRKSDLNGDGVLSFEEFESFLRTLREVAGSVATNTADLIFALFDVDGNQQIDENEFREIYRYFTGHRPTESEFQQEWARLNVGFRSAVRRDEYVRWLQTSKNPLFRVHAPPGGALASETLDSASSQQFVATDGSCGASGRGSEGPQALSATNHGSVPWPASPSAGETVSTEDRSQRLWKRGGLGPKFGARMGRHGSGIIGRPKWNNALYDCHIFNPNEPKHKSHALEPGHLGVPKSATLGSPLTVPHAKRQYFSRHQSLPELVRYYDTHHGVMSAGFKDLCDKLCQPGQISQVREALPGPKRKDGILSDPVGPNEESLPILPGRHVPGGRMRDHVTGEPTEWVNLWSSAPQLKEHYTNSTSSLRTPGVPPRHLYADEYYDDEY